MRIAIIGDTHLKKDSSQLELLADRIADADADLVVHAGDYGDYQVLDYLRSRFNFVGVWGNTDDNLIKASLNEKEIIDVNSFRIGIFHGHGNEKTTQIRAYDAFEGDQVDAIVFGHSHQPSIFTKNKVLMLNPGSPTNKRKEQWFSYITLDVNCTGLYASLTLFNK